MDLGIADPDYVADKAEEFLEVLGVALSSQDFGDQDAAIHTRTERRVVYRMPFWRVTFFVVY